MTKQTEKETRMDKLHEKTETEGNCGFSKFITLLFASFAKKKEAWETHTTFSSQIH